MRAILLAAALASCATPPASESAPASADPIIAAERAFAADGERLGWAAAFRRWHAPGAITLSPGPVSAAESLAAFEGDGETNLEWRPAYAGVSQGGDFGFTTGPFQIRGGDRIVGHYFTVWRRQPDGAWRWVFDAGTGVADPGPAVANDAWIPTLPVAAFNSGSAETAVAEIAAIEEAARTLGGLLTFLSEDVRVNRERQPSAKGRDAGFTLFAVDAPAAMVSVHRESAPRGDMVFSLGEVRDAPDAALRVRYYARIWQKQAAGWRIVFDEIVPHRGSPPA